ncbi:MAG: hypothetical protein ACR2OZ_06890 [Verrucomicrobiales bacterium]
MKPTFRVYPGMLRLIPVLWLEQTGGPKVLKGAIAFATLDSALKQARFICEMHGCRVTFEQTGRASENFDFGPWRAGEA